MNRQRVRRAVLAGVLLLGAPKGHALSLRSTRAEVFLGDVRPGAGVAFSAAVGARLGVENAGEEPAELSWSLSKPPLGALADGYEPIPDLGWVRLDGKARRDLLPGARAEMDLLVTVPREESPAGGQYQFDCLIRGRQGAQELTLRTKVLFAVGGGDPAEIAGGPEGSSFELSPISAREDDVALGRKAAARTALKLVNAGAEDMVVTLTSLREVPADVRLEPGYERAPNPFFLKAGPPVAVKAGSIAKAAFELEIPREARYRGRRWAFVVAADAPGRGRRWFTLNVSTEQTDLSHKEKRQ